jgi:ankyrin repeat protein
MIISSPKNDTLNCWSDEESNTTNAATTETLLDDTSDALTNEMDHANIIEFLLQTGSGDSNAALLCAVHDGRMNVVQYLLQKCNINTHATNSERKTALYLAVEKYDANVCGSLDIVKCLVNYSSGGNEATNSNLLTTFHLAVKKGHVNIVLYMLEHSCVTVEYGRQPALDLAVHANNLEIVECLLAKDGIDVVRKMSDGYNVLQNVCVTGKLNFVKCLVENVALMQKIQVETDLHHYVMPARWVV